MELGDFGPVFQVLFFAVLTMVLYHILLMVMKITSTGPPTGGRLLGAYEDLYYLRYENRDGAGILCLVLSLKSKKKLLKEHVEKALILLARRQPMLRAVVVKNAKLHEQGTYLKLISEDKIPEMLDIHVSSQSDWTKAWSELSEKPFNKLSWRVVLMKDEYIAEDESYRDTLVFAFNHAFIDGVFGIKFAKQFLQNLNNIAMKSDAYKPPLPLESDVTQLLKNGRQSPLKILCDLFGLSLISKLIYRRKLRNCLSAKQTNPFFVKFPSNQTASPRPTTKILHKVYSNAETSKIINACKRNNCTVTGAMLATAHMGLCKILNTGLNRDLKLKHSFAINAKPFCKPALLPEDYLGHFALNSYVFLNVIEEREFWRLAQESTAQIRSSLKDEEFIHQHIATCQSFSPNEYLNEILSPREQVELNRLSFCAGISSAGSFNFNEEGTDLVHEVDSCMFWNLVHRMISVFCFFNVTVNGKMSSIIAYDFSRFSDDHAEQISKWCFESLLRFSQDN